MTAPRHLWSGDWQLDSAAAAEELAKRRGQSEEPPPAPPEPPRGPSAQERLTAALRELRRLVAALIADVRAPRPARPPRPRRQRVDTGMRRRLGVALALAAILAAVVALGANALAGGGHGSQTATGTRAWLGVSLTNSPLGSGAMVAGVSPGSPAQVAGLQAGDVITQIGNQQVQTPADVNAALDGLVPGNQIQIQFNRGPVSFSTLVTLGSRRSAGP